VRRTTAVIAAVAAALLLGACSDSTDAANVEPNGLAEKSALEIFQTGARTTTETTDVTTQGKLPVDGRASTLTSRFGGANAEALVVSKDYTFEVKTNGALIFVRGEEEFWVDLVGKTQAQRIGGKWARTLVDGPLAPFAQFVDLDFYFRASGRIEKGVEKEVAGRPAVSVIDPPSNTDATWWFATTGEPVLLRYRSGKNTSIDLSYDETVIVQLPPPEDTIDISAIKVSERKQKDS
jgi:hypothetical protein